MARHTNWQPYGLKQDDTQTLIRAILLASFFYGLFLLLLSLKLFDPTQKLPIQKLLSPNAAPIKLLPAQTEQQKKIPEQQKKEKNPISPQIKSSPTPPPKQPILETKNSPTKKTAEVVPPEGVIIPSQSPPSQNPPKLTKPVQTTQKKLPSRASTLSQTQKRASKDAEKKEWVPRLRQRERAWKRPTLSRPEDQQSKQKLSPRIESSEKISQGFADFIEKKQKKMVFGSTNKQDGYYWGQTAEENARKAEALSFFEHFLFSFCELSYQNQLSLKGIIARSHKINAEVTINKQRSITNIRLTTPSPIPQLNDHIKYLLSILTPPLFPAHHTEKEIIVPLNIQISMDTQLKSLYFIPLKR